MGVAQRWKRVAGGEETASLATYNLRKIVTLFSFCFISAYMLQQQQWVGKHFNSILLVVLHSEQRDQNNQEWGRCINKMCGTCNNIQNSIKSHENEDWGTLTLPGKDGTKL